MSANCQSVVVGISGGTCSGKTTLAQSITSSLGPELVSYLPEDAYYKDQSHLLPAERDRVNFDHPACLDLALFAAHIRELKAGIPVDVPVYDFDRHTRCFESRRVCPASLILVEGILIFTDQAVRRNMDLKIYIDYPADLRLIRRLQRDVCEHGRTAESVIDQYVQTVRPMHNLYTGPSRRFADIVVQGSTGGLQRVGFVVANFVAKTVSSNEQTVRP